MRTFLPRMISGVLVLVQMFCIGIDHFSKSALYLRNFTLPDGASRIDPPLLFFLAHLHSSTECAVNANQMERNYFSCNEETSTCIIDIKRTSPGDRPVGYAAFVLKGNGINLSLNA